MFEEHFKISLSLVYSLSLYTKGIKTQYLILCQFYFWKLEKQLMDDFPILHTAHCIARGINKRLRELLLFPASWWGIKTDFTATSVYLIILHRLCCTKLTAMLVGTNSEIWSFLRLRSSISRCRASSVSSMFRILALSGNNDFKSVRLELNTISFSPLQMKP